MMTFINNLNNNRLSLNIIILFIIKVTNNVCLLLNVGQTYWKIHQLYSNIIIKNCSINSL